MPQQVMAHHFPTRKHQIVAARNSPLVRPQSFNPLPQGDYLKYFPKYTGEGEGVSAEEHLGAFYIYANNKNVDHEDVWSRIVFQILDGEARKWFRKFPPNSII